MPWNLPVQPPDLGIDTRGYLPDYLDRLDDGEPSGTKRHPSSPPAWPRVPLDRQGKGLTRNCCLSSPRRNPRPLVGGWGDAVTRCTHRPWIFAELRHYLRHHALAPDGHCRSLAMILVFG